MAPRDSTNIKSSPSSSGLTRSPSVASVGIPGSSSFRSLNIGRSSSSTSVATSSSHPKVRPMSPEELDSDRDIPPVPALPGKARKIVGKLSGVGVPDLKSKKAAAGGKTSLPSTPTSGSAASRRMTGTPAKLTKKAKAAAAGKEGGSKERVVVCVRAKPPIPTPCIYDFSADENLLTLNDLHPTNVKRGGITKGREQEGEFPIDHLHLPPTSTSELYTKLVSPIVTSTVEGYNGTVFAYGMTGSGKTHTMGGVESDPGVIPRSIDQIFDSIDEDKDRAFFLRVTYLELYNESLRDLLNPSSKLVPIIHERDGKVCVDNLEEVPVKSPEEVQLQLKKGEANRRVGKTDFNEHSSRSHTIFSIIIESRLISDSSSSAIPQTPTLSLPSSFSSSTLLAGLACPSPPLSKSGGVVRLSRLNLIDLAGSEKATSDGDRQKEGGFINKSLLDLATVIEKLTEAKPPSHIPYRNSKLTRLLQDSLSGHARIAVICTISVQEQHSYEALATLKFARRVSRIVTRAEKGTVVPEDALMEYYRNEIADLKKQLAKANASSRGSPIKTLSDESSDEEEEGGEEKRKERIRELNAARVQHEEDVQRLQMERTKLQSQISNMAGFILTSEAVPQSPSGFAFGGLKGRSRRRISDLPLGLGRPTDQAPTNQKRFASAMTFVEEGSEGARTPLKRADAKDEKVPSISVAEHEAALAALQNRIASLEAESAGQQEAETRLATTGAEVARLTASLSESQRSLATLTDESTAALSKEKAAFGERVAALETRLAEVTAQHESTVATLKSAQDESAALLSKEKAAFDEQLAALETRLAEATAQQEASESTLKTNRDEAATQLGALKSQKEARIADLERAVTEGEENRSTLEERLKVAEQQSADALEKQKSGFEARLAAFEVKITESDTKLSAAAVSSQEAEASLADLKAEVERLQTEADVSRSTLDKQTEESIRAHADTLSSIEIKHNVALEELQAQLVALKATHEEASVATKARFDEAQTEAMQARLILEETHSKEVDKHQSRLVELEATVVALEAKVGEHSKSEETFRSEASTHQARVEELDSKIAEVQSHADAQHAALEETHVKKAALLQARIVETEEKVRSAQDTAATAEAALGKAHEEKASSLQARIDALESQLVDAGSSAEKGRSELEKSHEEKASSLQATVVKLELQVENFKTLLARQSESDTAHASALQTLQTRIAELMANEADAATRLSAQEETHASLADSLSTRITALEAQLAESESSAASSSSQLEALHAARVDALELQISEHAAQLAKLKNDNDAHLAARVETHKAELSGLKKAIAEMETAANDRAVSGAAEASTLKETHSSELSALQDKIAHLKAQLVDLRTHLDLSVPQESHQAELSALQTRVAEMEKDALETTDAHQRSLEETRSLHEASLKAAKDEGVATLEAALSEHASQQDESHRLALEKAHARTSDLEEALIGLEASHQSRLEALLLQHSSLLEEKQREASAVIDASVKDKTLAEEALRNAMSDHIVILEKQRVESQEVLETVIKEQSALQDQLREVQEDLSEQAELLSVADATLEDQRQLTDSLKGESSRLQASLEHKITAFEATIVEKDKLLQEQAAAAAKDKLAIPTSSWTGMTKSPSIAEGLNLAHTGSLRETRRRSGHKSNLSFAAPSRMSSSSPQDEEISKLNSTIQIQRDLIIDLQDKVRIWGEQARKNDKIINELLEEVCSGRLPNVQALSNKWSSCSSLTAQSPFESMHKRSTQTAPTSTPLTPSKPPSNLRQSALNESLSPSQPFLQTPPPTKITPSTPKTRAHHLVNSSYIPSGEKPPPLPHASHQRSNSAAKAARRITIEHDMNALKATSKVEQSRSVFDSPVAKLPAPLRKI